MSAPEIEEEAEIGTIDLGLDDDDGLVDGFDGVEDGGDDGGRGDSGGQTQGSSGPDADVSISEAIENGLAECAAVGLEGAERERVRSEMKAIAQQFHVGYFGQRTAEKYMAMDLDEIPPEYGLAAALTAFAVVAIYKRPDGRYRVRQAYNRISEQFGDGESSAPDVTDETDTETEEPEESENE